MTGWTALLPLKLGGGGKSRLTAALSDEARQALAVNMARHVADTLCACHSITQVVILSPVRPDWWSGAWSQDRGRGLNEELTAWRQERGAGPLLVIHGDLPLVTKEEVEHLLAVADAAGAAMATDRAGTGTNALALAEGREVAFAFGPDSRARHTAQFSQLPVIQLDGLANDLDTPDDLARIEQWALFSSDR